MRYLHLRFDAHKGKTVRIHFDQPAKVMLMSAFHYGAYIHNHSFSYMGGFKEKSPFEVHIPIDSKWHAVVELGSYNDPKKINARVEVI